jgi:hypothetical protein
MKTRAKLAAVLLGCSLGLACSQSSQPGSGGVGGSGGSGQTGGASGSSSTGGSADGGTAGAASGGSGGSSLAGRGGAAAGGSSAAASGGSTAGGNGDGGSSAAGGSKPQGTGGAALGGNAGTSTGGAGAVGTGGAVAGGASGKGTGGAAGANNGGSTTTAGGGSTGAGTGGGGGVGTGGSTGAGGSSSSLVVPTTVASSGRDRFAFGDVIFEVDPKVGARVGKLSLGGADMVVSSGTKTDQTDWGAVFWTSPQSAWDKNWPPPAALDSSPYTGGISGAHLALDSTSYAALGVSVSKDFSADSATGWITIVYTIKASKAVQAAPWENCRVPRGGLAFFPSGTSLTKGPLTMTESGDMVWFDDASKSATSPSGDKAVADGSGGWLAYALGGNLLLRKYVDTPADALAPKEGDDEIYPGSGFLELEVQGPYTSIAAGESLTWTVAWRIVKIPSTVTVSAGSTSLADFAKQQAAL